MQEIPLYLEEVLRIIKEKTGIDWKRKGITRAFLKEVESAKAEGFLELLPFLRWDSPEFQRIISHFTVPEGYFFRYRKQFELLRERIIPEILTKRDKINIGSIGSGRGEEVYSIAIVVKECVPSQRRGAIVGFDINFEFLERAREGLFTKSSFRESVDIMRYFNMREDGYYEIKEELKKMVEFYPLNVLESNPEYHGFFDIILFRNVLIYIDKEKVERVTKNVLDMLKEDGIIMFGHTDILPNMRLPIEEYDRHLFVYRKLKEEEKEKEKKEEPRMIKVFANGDRIQEREEIKKGVMYFNKGHLDEAERIFNEVLQHNPANPVARAGLMFIMLEKGMVEKAIYQIEAEDGSVLLPELYYLKGLISLNSNKYELAREFFEKGLRVNPRLPQLRIGKALAHLHLGETEEAKKELEIAEGFLKEELEENTFLPPGGIPTLKMYIAELKKMVG